MSDDVRTDKELMVMTRRGCAVCHTSNYDLEPVVVEIVRLRRGMELILEFGDATAQAIAEEAVGDVVGGAWFSPENVER